jgi:hypothetical protein
MKSYHYYLAYNQYFRLHDEQYLIYNQWFLLLLHNNLEENKLVSDINVRRSYTPLAQLLPAPDVPNTKLSGRNI